jgi:hypothetical protein
MRVRFGVNAKLGRRGRMSDRSFTVSVTKAWPRWFVRMNPCGPAKC